VSAPNPDPHKRLGQILKGAQDAFAQTGAGRALVPEGLLDLLALALPYVEAAQDDEAHDAAGKARARALAARIRAAIGRAAE